jgi:hypothetical protein
VTYRQRFDEAIGESPTSAVDVGRIVACEERRTRMRRTGAAGLAAVAVLAAAVGVGVLRDEPFATPTVAEASATPSAGVKTDQQRLTDAMLAALDREAPGLGWVTGATNPDPQTWDGPITDKPAWKVNAFSHLSASGWMGFGVVARDDVRAVVWIDVSTPKGSQADSGDCAGTDLVCETSAGPNGERIRFVSFDGFRVPPNGPVERKETLDVEVFRPDGSKVTVRIMGPKNQSVLTQEQLTRIALSPEISLH